ncbi:hypothetical protein ACFFWD_22295 [Bradyrhizobium erythrophlei]|uniref:hypothetical protein n=1 Tax=Bradyrhizobium erythrophlei TaxID=1437360 RepID=UPI0035ED1857
MAFVLAATTNPVNADAPIDTNPAGFFRSGSLADTLRDASATSGRDEGGAGVSRIQLSQWFNFFNCFSGVWRRC